MAHNIAALYAAQIAAYLLPLITVPYLARVLGPEGFGEVAFAQSFAAWSALIVEFGFAYSATRDLARLRRDPLAVAELAAGVLGAKLLLVVGLAAAVMAAAQWVAAFHGHVEYLIGAGFLAVAQGFSPLWYFQGIERMGLATLRDVCGRGLAVLAIFAFVRGAGDGPKVLYFAAAGAAAAAVANYRRLYQDVRFVAPQWRQSLTTVRKASALFLFRASVSLYTSANVFILGLFVPAFQVADYAGAEKIVRAFLGLVSPVTQAVYPRVSNLALNDPPAASKWIKRTLGVLVCFAGLAAICLAAVAPWLIRLLLGPGYEGAVPLLRLLAVVLPLVAASGVLGVLWMLPLQMDKWFNAIICAGGAVNIALAIPLVPRIGTIGMAFSVVGTEMLVTAAMALTLWRGRSPALLAAGRGAN